ncbi:hypothetical protein [Streptococcus sp. S784/96/1]|uniref:hypothetical protein n=1 Tax=Streptococcus sp. S784/96/1 TaxID=2653499 RepID=UPI001EE4E6C8|nr:hypothetical protein [Streptococcus sp. S784/96/1]
MKITKCLRYVILSVIGVCILTACGAKNDNGTYVYQVDAPHVNGRYDEGEATWEVTTEIDGETGSLTFETLSDDGNDKDSQKLTVDQDRKTLTAENDGSTVDYTIEVNVLTLDTDDSRLKQAEFVKE